MSTTNPQTHRMATELAQHERATFIPFAQAETTHAQSPDIAHLSHDSAIMKTFRYASIGAAAIALPPLVLPQLGIGTEQARILMDKCCPMLSNGGVQFIKQNAAGKKTFGIAGALSAMFERIPVAGGFISKSGVNNALAAGGIIVVGHYLGNGIEAAQKKNSPDPDAGFAGRMVRNGSHVVGVITALPSILPGVGHGLLFLSSTIGLDTLHPDYTGKGSSTARGPATRIAKVLGKMPGACLKESKMIHAEMGSGAILTAQLCCMLPVIIPAVSGWLSGRDAAKDNTTNWQDKLDKIKTNQLVAI